MEESPRYLKLVVFICWIMSTYAILSYIYFFENQSNNTVCSVPQNQTCKYEEPYLSKGCTDLQTPRILLMAVSILIPIFVFCVQVMIYRYIRLANSDIGGYYVTSLGLLMLIGALPAIINVVVYGAYTLGSFSCTEEWAGCSPVCFSDYPLIAVMWSCILSLGLVIVNILLILECYLEVWHQIHAGSNVVELERI